MFTKLKSLTLIYLSTVILFLGCNKDEDSPFKKQPFNKKSESPHFEYYYDDSLSADQILPLENALEKSYDSITTLLNAGTLPKIRIAIWADQTEFEESMGNKFPGAAGYVVGREEVRVVYIASPGMLKGVVHEFVHAVTLFVSEGFANNPRWLWEAVAQYLSGSFVHPKTQSYLVKDEYPTMAVLSNERGNQRIYPLGYTIGEFIVQKWGYEGLQTLIKKHGNTESAFGITIEQFEEQWKEFIKQKYF